MARLRPSGPYIWVTWLTKLLAGEASCEWASWFKTQHEGSSWSRVPSDFDQTQWVINHTAQLNRCREEWERRGYTAFTEGQNGFNLRGHSATLAGKPDIIATRQDSAIIIDVKTGAPRPSHAVQVMLYMYAIPRARPQYKDILFTGQVAYQDHQVDIPASSVNSQFIQTMGQLIRRLAASEPARKIPSRSECAFCDITSGDCPERVTGQPGEEGTTDDF